MMLGSAAKELGHSCVFVDPNADCSASHVGDVLNYSFDDISFVKKLASSCDVVSYEFENVDTAILNALQKSVPVHPSLSLLEVSKDRYAEKIMLNDNGIETAKFRKVESEVDAHRAAVELGFPFILKTRRFGYDGKGQYFLKNNADLLQAVASIETFSHIAESLVPFDLEVSKIATRSAGGSIAYYPLTQNIHKGGILQMSVAPAFFSEAEHLNFLAEQQVEKICSVYDYIGTLAVEFFVCGKKLIANEIAPRVHNSGHWTLDGGSTSQFENHIRAITGMPLGSTEVSKKITMVNVIGTHVDSQEIKKLNGVEYDYKKSARPGRKLAHFNLVDASDAVIQQALSL